ncbi:hypothetical protein RRG08_025501 [Elysia crispata]|uniref:Uncharacterized protein n=1 Tax=Elysia crispata TaxID=231223 RepID=A0AAE0Y119_9GAST|nr:hypothetical protein RRG08_025501 [Elysia crispata]
MRVRGHVCFSHSHRLVFWWRCAADVLDSDTKLSGQWKKTTITLDPLTGGQCDLRPTGHTSRCVGFVFLLRVVTFLGISESTPAKQSPFFVFH